MVKFVDEILIRGFVSMLMNNFRKLCAHAIIITLKLRFRSFGHGITKYVRFGIQNLALQQKPIIQYIKLYIMSTTNRKALTVS